MPLTHRQLCEVGARWLRRPFGARAHACAVAVTECRIDGTGRGEIADAIGFRFSGHRDGTVVVEAKTSRADFLADKRKSHRANTGLGNFRYYLAPEGMVSPDELPEKWGLVEVNTRGQVKTVHGAATLMERYGVEVDEAINTWRFDSDRQAELSLMTRLMSRVGDAEALNRRLVEVSSTNSALLRRVDELQKENRTLRTETLTMRFAMESAGVDLPGLALQPRVVGKSA